MKERGGLKGAHCSTIGVLLVLVLLESIGRLLALPANNRPVWNILAVVNPLA